MKKIIAIIMTIVASTGTVFAFGWISSDTKSDKFNMAPKSSKIIYYDWEQNSTVIISAKANKGRIHITVYDPKGVEVVSGKSKVRVNTSKQNGRYKVVFENKTNEHTVLSLNIMKVRHDTVISHHIVFFR